MKRGSISVSGPDEHIRSRYEGRQIVGLLLLWLLSKTSLLHIFSTELWVSLMSCSLEQSSEVGS